MKNLNHTKVKKICDICKEKFDYNSKNIQKVKEHYHFTGKDCSAIHSISNLRYAISREVSIIMYNGPITNFILLLNIWGISFLKKYLNCLEKNTEKRTFFCSNG